MIEEGHMIEGRHPATGRPSPTVCEPSRVARSWSPTAASFLAVALVGCATGSALRPLDPSHPASPAAAEAAITEPATMLRETSPADEGEGSGPSPHSGHTMHGSSRSHGAASASARAEYVCPMHPEIRRSRPGQCPKCGMTLVGTDADAGESKGHP